MLFSCQNEHIDEDFNRFELDPNINGLLTIVEKMATTNDDGIQLFQDLLTSVKRIEDDYQLKTNSDLVNYLESKIDQIIDGTFDSNQQRASRSFATRDTLPFGAHEIWEVLTTTDNYSLWNPFTINVETTFEVGSPIIMTVNLLPFITIVQPETVEVFDPYSDMCWSSILIDEAIFSSYRCRSLIQLENGNSVYSNTMIYDGLLGPLVNAITLPMVYQGFVKETKGIADYLGSK